MGGNALKNTFTRRYEREEYYKLINMVIDTFMENIPCSCWPIAAYNNKQSFGDADLLCSIESGWQDSIPDFVKNHFGSKELVKNGNVYSFDVEELQVDLILTPKEYMQTSYTYFAYNDLGNLMGRVAHKMGFKYGHKGLSVIVKDGDYVIGEHVVSKDSEKIFEFLGYSWERFCEGFDELEDIFKFAASSPYFNKDIYLLDNRNHKGRIRDAKRPTYTAFLKWLEEQPVGSLPEYAWNDLKELGGRELLPEALERAETFFPGTKEAVEALYKQREKVKASHAKWNGNIVRARTGLEGKELGELMKAVKERLTWFAEASMPAGSDYHDAVLFLFTPDITRLEQEGIKEMKLQAECRQRHIDRGHDKLIKGES
jgi:hypothetical protein